MTNTFKSIFEVKKMDCPCEERLITMTLQDIHSVISLDFDLEKRVLTVIHTEGIEMIQSKLDALNLNSNLIETKTNTEAIKIEDPRRQQKVLIIVLIINFAFFIIEMFSGILSSSMGLIADSLDMLADALVYGMSLMVVGAIAAKKKRVAALSGYLQITLALWGLSEVIKRFTGIEEIPDFNTMIGISLLALIANATCLWLLQRTKSKEVHIRASIIFSANDVIINIGVLSAGFLVWWLENRIPDLIIGVIVFLIVIKSAFRLLKLAK